MHGRDVAHSTVTSKKIKDQLPVARPSYSQLVCVICQLEEPALQLEQLGEYLTTARRRANYDPAVDLYVIFLVPRTAYGTFPCDVRLRIPISFPPR